MANETRVREKERWLGVSTQTALHVVPTANYLRYGPTGVRRFGPNAGETNAPHPHQITLMLTLKNAHGESLLQYESLQLEDVEPDSPFDLEGTNIWAGKHEEAHLRIIWVWDFYRMFSGFRVDVEIPPEKATPSDAWKTAYEALQELKPGDQIVVSVQSGSGDILHVYPVCEPAIEGAV